jgi:hypothetical protein
VLKQKNQAGLWASVKKEFHFLETKGGWEAMSAGRRVVGNRWVLTENDDGTLRSRTVAQCFSQVPGNDCTVMHRLLHT